MVDRRSTTEIMNQEATELKREEEMYEEIVQEEDAQPEKPKPPQPKPRFIGVDSWDQDI